MRIDVSEPVLCGCDTCVQHRTFITQETEPTNVIGSSSLTSSVPVSSGPVQPLGSTSGESSGTETTPSLAPPPVTTSVNSTIFKFPPAVTPVSSGPVQALGSTSDQSSGTETTPPLAPPPPPVTTSVNHEPVQSVDSAIFKFPPAVTPVSSEPAQALAPAASGSMQGPAFGFGAFAAHRPWSVFGASATSEVNGSSPISFAPPVTTVSSAPVQEALGTSATAASSTSSPVQSSSPTMFQFHPAFTSCAASGPMQAPTFASGASTATCASSTSSPFDAPSPLKWGSLQAPVQANGPNTFTPFSFLPAQDSGNTAASAFPPSFGYPGAFARPDGGVSPAPFCGQSHFSSPSGRAPKNPFGSFLHPAFGVRYPSNLFGPNSQTTTPVSGRSPFWPGVEPNPQTTTPVSGRSPFWPGVGTEQGSRYPPYAPTPDHDNSGGPGKQIISISASNSHGHKSHEELRWEDYKNGDKGGFGWFPAAHTTPFSAPTVSPSLFAPPSIHDRPRMRTVDLTQQNMSGFPLSYNTPTPFQRPHEPVGVSSPASGCTACGATSSSSPSSHLGFNVATNPPSAATSLPGLFVSTYGSCPLLFATPSLAAYGTTTTPAVQAYAMMFGTPNLAAQGTTTTPAVQVYPMMFGILNLATQGTTTPAAQPYHMMYGTPNHVAQGTTTTPAVLSSPTMFGTLNLAGQGTTTPAVQPYPTMFGTPNLAGQGTTTTPAAQPYPTMFGTPNLAAQGTTRTPAAQPSPTMFGVTQASTTPAVQPYAMMFGTPSLGAQGTTLAGQAYPAHGLNLLPFAAMSLQ